MIKQELISQIRAKLLAEKPGADNSYLADERRVERDISNATNAIFFQIFKKNPENLDRYSKSYYNIPVIQDLNSLIYYSSLPAKVIQFPIVGDGVRQVNLMQSTDVNFVPMKLSDRMFFASTDAGNITSTIGYIVTAQTSNGSSFDGIVQYFGNGISSISSVKMDLVVDFTEYLSTEDYPIPAGQDENIINMIIQQFKATLRPAHRIANEQEL